MAERLHTSVEVGVSPSARMQRRSRVEEDLARSAQAGVVLLVHWGGARSPTDISRPEQTHPGVLLLRTSNTRITRYRTCPGERRLRNADARQHAALRQLQPNSAQHSEFCPTCSVPPRRMPCSVSQLVLYSEHSSTRLFTVWMTACGITELVHCSARPARPSKCSRSVKSHRTYMYIIHSEYRDIKLVVGGPNGRRQHAGSSTKNVQVLAN